MDRRRNLLPVFVLDGQGGCGDNGGRGNHGDENKCYQKIMHQSVSIPIPAILARTN